MAAKWKTLKTDKLFSVNTRFRNPLQNFSFLTVTSSEIRTTFIFEGFLPEPEKTFFPFKSRATPGKKKISFWEQRATLRTTLESLKRFCQAVWEISWWNRTNFENLILLVYTKGTACCAKHDNCPYGFCKGKNSRMKLC